MYLSVLYMFLVCLCQVLTVCGRSCFSCNSIEHPGICDYYGNLTNEHTQHIVECKGSCKVGTLRDRTEEAHLRMCEENVQTGCEKTENGFICQCLTNLCNKDLETCRNESRCILDMPNLKMESFSLGNQIKISIKSIFVSMFMFSLLCDFGDLFLFSLYYLLYY